MKKKHGILWYIVVFPFIAPFYLAYYIFLFFISLSIYMIQLPFRICQICFKQIVQLFKIPFSHKETVTNGIEYEQYCANYLNRHGYRNAKVTKASGDHGVDVIAYRRGKKYAVQCKYYSSPVGNKAIQEVYTGIALYDCNHGIVITNSTFTKQAKAEASKLGIKLMPMVEPQGKLFPVKSILAFIIFILFLVYPKEVIIFLSIILFMILVYYLGRRTYLKMKYKVPEQETFNSEWDLEEKQPSTEIEPTLTFENTVEKDLSYISEVDPYTTLNQEKCEEKIITEQLTEQVSEQVSNHDRSETKHKEPKRSNNSSRSITTKPKPTLSRYDLERYAVMCNADLEHKDEMEQYK